MTISPIRPSLITKGRRGRISMVPWYLETQVASMSSQRCATTERRKRGSGPDALYVSLEQPKPGRRARRPAAPGGRPASQQLLVGALGGGHRQHLRRISQDLQRRAAIVGQDRRPERLRLGEHEAESLGDDEVGKEGAERRADLGMDALLRLGAEIIDPLEARRD